MAGERAGGPPADQAARAGQGLADPARGDTVVTRAFTGRPARALPNRFTERYSDLAPTGYPALHYLTSPLRKASIAAGDPERVNRWAGTGWREVAEEPELMVDEQTGDPPIAEGSALVDGPSGADIWPALALRPTEHVVKQHRYSAFFAIDLAVTLREWDIDTVGISGTTTENCCHATASDAMYRNYRVAFLSDVTGTFDYPDIGQGAMSAEDVHRATLTILAFSTAQVMTAIELRALVTAGHHD